MPGGTGDTTGSSAGTGCSPSTCRPPDRMPHRRSWCSTAFQPRRSTSTGSSTRLAAHRRVVLFDLLGFGLSDKPDRAYRLVDQADLAVTLCAELGLERLGLLTHDIGDTVGGELLARQLEGAWDVEVTDRVLVNGSVFMDLVHLSDGQRLLESLPDERLAAGVLDRATWCWLGWWPRSRPAARPRRRARRALGS